MSFIYQSSQPAPQSMLRALNPSQLPHPQDVPRPGYLLPQKRFSESPIQQTVEYRKDGRTFRLNE